MPQVEVNNTHLHYQKLGAQGSVVVMLHGLLVGNMAGWYFGAAGDLAHDHQVYMYDLRGHGLSEQSPTGYDLETMVCDLGAFLDNIQESRVTLVGHSYGALIALKYALKNPERVDRLVVIEAPIPPSKGAQIETFQSLEPHEILQALPEQLRSSIQAQKRQAQKFLNRLDFLLFKTDLLKNLKAEADLSEHELQQLQVPVLLVYANDAQLKDVGLRLKNTLPKSQISWLSGGHYLPSERPKEISKEISGFLKK